MTMRICVEIVDVPQSKRQPLRWILDESFEGWYLRHSKRTLREIEEVRAAVLSDKPLGLVMLKTFEKSVGYVYYIAVSRYNRRKGLAKLLLEDAIKRFEI